tara:strand:+ start:269 stop:988 length:720 start_codon:yes stop_codon:yes gene_type:complete
MPEFIHTGKDKKKFVQKMFDDISDNYDFLNRLLSLGIDIYWRKKIIQSMDIKNGQHIIDIATGTGDVAFAIDKKYDVSIVGLDISKNMLKIAKVKLEKKKTKNTKIEFIHGDAEDLPMGDNSYDHICISFGFRNLGNYDKALKEFYRVLKPGGRLCILEFSQSKSKIFNFIFSFYFNKVLPRVAAFISRADAYRYLPESVKYFPNQSKINDFLDNNNFTNVTLQTLTFGVATIYKGIKD